MSGEWVLTASEGFCSVKVSQRTRAREADKHTGDGSERVWQVKDGKGWQVKDARLELAGSKVGVGQRWQACSGVGGQRWRAREQVQRDWRGR